MKLNKTVIACALLFKISHSLFIPLESFNRMRTKIINNELNPIDGVHFEQDLEVVTPEVKQLLSIFENITNQTESELASMFLSQDHSLALLSLKFWVYLLKTFFVNNNHQILGMLHGLDTGNLLNGLLDGDQSLAKHLERSFNNSLQAPNQIGGLASIPVTETVNIDVTIQHLGDVDSEGENKSYGPDMSYESLQKWIEDYGLSASSLRDYLETYLFNGDRPWTAEIASYDSSNNSNDEKRLELESKLASFEDKIHSAVASGSAHADDMDDTDDNDDIEETDTMEELHVQSFGHVPFTLEGSDSDEDEEEELQKAGQDYMFHQFISKRSLLDNALDYSTMVNSFARLDENEPHADDASDTDEFEQTDFESKHRIFDDDEIVEPFSVLLNESPRSKDYRQVVYDAMPDDPRLAKREEDCVPVTWYNVFHHSVFGKHKFCHV
ncbi:hypothetical protein OXX79_008390 [Metschnikowia pulcherrima]